MTSNAYSFLPWLRTGLSTKIAGATEHGRATIPVELELAGDALPGRLRPGKRLVSKPVQLYGPGDVVGVDPRAISRVEPRPGVGNFEPNYLAHIEFYQEDFAWRYSPAKASDETKRLDPWLALVVLAEGTEFEDGVAGGRPLPFITVKDPTALPRPDQLGAFAHVHVEGELDVPVAVDEAEAMGTALANLTGVLRDRPDHACSRILCPRHLRPSTDYHAFLVPAFETGRRAGLGEPPGDDATKHSWGEPDSPQPVVLPYYHRWSFATGTTGDFEYLVRLLKPVEADSRVGRRDLDAHRDAGFGLPPFTTPRSTPGGVLKLGGALQLPDSDKHIDEFENWDGYYDPEDSPYPNQWQRALAGLINLGEAYQHNEAKDANAVLAPLIPRLDDEVDPVITPPLYGRWHALTPQLLVDGRGQPVPDAERKNWVHRLNLDPRYRVAAHFGTQVVQARQEEFMAAAWDQVGEVLKANAKIRAAQLAVQVGDVLHGKHFQPKTPPTAPAAVTPPSRALMLTAPAHSRVTQVPPRAAPAAPADGPEDRLAVGARVAESRVSAAPVSPAMRRIVRPGARLVKTLGFPDPATRDALVQRIDDLEVTAAPPKPTPAAVITPAILDQHLDPKPPGDPGDALPVNENFHVREITDTHVDLPGGVRDSAEAGAFRDALKKLYAGLHEATAAATPAPRPPLAVADTTAKTLDELRSSQTVVGNLLSSVSLPERLKPVDGKLVEVMAYPAIDVPMYGDLLKMSTDTFVPNIGLVPPNSITLLENNRRFIESYLIGLNHEMARELLWREYPTDSRGTPFRQFWDPRAVLPLPDEKPEERRERLYDIRPLHEWGKSALLGENDNRQAAAADQENDLVLVIRGELLKKYPNAAVYAHKAAWPLDEHGNPDTSGERVLADFSDELPPPADLLKLPSYEAKIEPDIYLLGFDLSAEKARGDGKTDLGWFFVLKERPGDPRFGADESQAGPAAPIEVWNDVDWGRLDPHDHRFVELDPDVHFGLDAFNGDEDDQEKKNQRADDDWIKVWDGKISAADVAYILFQAPVLVAVHAQEMLRDA